MWFSRRKLGWRQGFVSRVLKPTVYVKFGNTLFPTHETRVRPFFDDYFISPEVLDHDNDELELPGDTLRENETLDLTEQEPLSQKITSSSLLNNVAFA